MQKTACLGLFIAAVTLVHLPAFAQVAGVSEGDFMNEMPTVLSVSRLSQRLDEAPGAVTVINRDMIRLSGARDVAELLRWVPGFQVNSSFEADAPTASYHGAFNEFTSRMQVLIDGRTAYSTYLSGSVGLGMLSVAMEDIERIEVLRGSNSAAYGARAFLGVVNIVTRLPVESYGWALSAKAGENGVNDRLARLGWGNDSANYRLTLDERGDDGLAGSNGHNRVRRANLRGDFRPSARDELQLRTGAVEVLAGVGQANRAGKLLHDHTLATGYAQLDWRRNMGPDEDLLLSLSLTRESIDDVYPYPLKAEYPAQFAVLKFFYPQLGDSFPISFSGTAADENLSIQHTLRHNDKLRLVWGGELRREAITSAPLFNTTTPQTTHFSRLFGNLEWKPRPDLVLNLGGMGERSSMTGTNFSPRVMANWHVAPGHTLRFGGTRAYRPYSMLEKNGNQVFQTDGVVLQLGTIPSGQVFPERVFSREIGYLADLPNTHVSLDVRVFQEDISGFVKRAPNLSYPIPASVVFKTAPYMVSNGEDVHIGGVEYQLKWRPVDGTQLILNQSYTDIDSANTDRLSAAPQLASSLMWFQRLPGNMSLSLMHQSASPAAPPATSRVPASMSRTDLRLAKKLRLGPNSAEVALVVQNLGKPYVDYQQGTTFERRAYVTFRLEN